MRLYLNYKNTFFSSPATLLNHFYPHASSQHIKAFVEITKYILQSPLLMRKNFNTKYAYCRSLLEHGYSTHLVRIAKDYRWLDSWIKAKKFLDKSAFDSQIRKAWKEHETNDYDDALFAHLKVGPLQIDESVPYDYMITKYVAIWFSTNPKVAIREKEKQCMRNRCALLRGKQVLIYSSDILDSIAKKQIRNFCKLRSILLIDIDSQSLFKKLSPSSRILLNRAKLELCRLHNGGNAAAASDLIRWIPELMFGSVYGDIDLAIQEHEEPHLLPHFKAGLPVVLNMGSIQTTLKGNSRTSEESCSLNTDIIAYSNSIKTNQFMKTISSQLI